MPKVIALDFDGVLCDALNECILVSWNGHVDNDISTFGDQGLAAIPSNFVDRFVHCRSFARHLGHFIVPIMDTRPIRTQADFDAAFARIQREAVEEFMAKVTAYRHRVRTQRTPIWLAYHSLYPGLADALRGSMLPTYIVTAKDSGSVHELLQSWSVVVDTAKIYGEQRAKLSALSEIARLEAASTSDILFVDDSIQNVLAARRAGYDAVWASWGYHAAEHVELASKHAVPAMSLDQFCEAMAQQWRLARA